MEISSFIVMDTLERAKELEAEGIDVVHMEVGEPDFPTPQEVIEAGREALSQKVTFYTQSVGIPALKENIARHYHDLYGLDVSPDRIVITPGSSPALMAVLRVTLEKRAACGLPDPGYPCYKNMVSFFGGRWKPLNVFAGQGFKVLPKQLEGIDSVVLNSPSNPTGAVYSREELEELVRTAEINGITIVSDEIYHGIAYTDYHLPSVLEFTDRAIVVNGFSKFFLMTGWRLGWMVVPQNMVRLMQCIAQNLFICPPAVAQHAALACFSSGVMEQLKEKVAVYRQRRDYLVDALNQMGITVNPVPQGAFYIYADVSRYTDDSFGFCKRALEEAHIGISPGVDFGSNNTNLYIRLSYANTLERLKEGMMRLEGWLP